MDDALNVEIYDKSYLSHQTQKGKAAYDKAWSDLLEHKRHLCFHVHPSLHQHDVSDKRRYFCLDNDDMERASSIIEARTIATLEKQKLMLEQWNVGATGVQTLWRGYAARKVFLHRYNLRSKAVLERHFQKQIRLAKIRQSMAARSIQRHWRRYWALCVQFAWAVGVVDRSVSLHLFRSRRLKARNRIARWQKRILYRYKLMLGVKRLHRIATEAQKRALAAEAATYFQHSQRFRDELRELTYFVQDPDVFVLHRRVKTRKYDLYQRKKQNARFRRSHRVHVGSGFCN